MIKIGIRGYGNYGRLLHALARRFVLTAQVVVYDPACEVDGYTFVRSEDMADCDVMLFAVPMHAFEVAVLQVLAIPGIREDMIFVDVCSGKRESGALLARLAGEHPYVCLHTPWGPEAYANKREDITQLPPIVVTDCTVPFAIGDEVGQFLTSKGFRFRNLSADEHDGVLAGEEMYVTHLVSQIIAEMGLLDREPSASTLSFQDLVRAGRTVRGDQGLFFDLWLSVPECQRTFERFMAIAHRLEEKKIAHAGAK